jgi:amino acid transporter
MVLLITVPISVFARRHSVTGSLMSLLGEELGSRWRPIPGAALLGSYVVALVMAALVMPEYLGSFLLDVGIDVAPNRVFQLTVIVLVVLIAMWLAFRGVVASVNVSVVLGLLCLPLTLVIVVAAAIHAGVHLGPQLHLEGVNSSGIAAGIFFTVAVYAGFEGLTALGKETKNPKRNIPVVLVLLVLMTAVIIFVGAVLQIPTMATHVNELNAGVSPSSVLADVGGVGWAKAPNDFLVFVSLGAGVIGYLNDSARIVATMGRDGGLPAWIGALHPQYRTPARAAYALGGLTILILVAYLPTNSDGMLLIMTNATVLMSSLWLIAYLATCVGGVVYGLRVATRNLSIAILSALGAFGVVAAYIYTIGQAGSALSKASPWIAIGWTAIIGTAIAASETRRARKTRATIVTADPDTALLISE